MCGILTAHCCLIIVEIRLYRITGDFMEWCVWCMFLLKMYDRAEKWYVHASFLLQHAFAVCDVSAHHKWIWLTFQDRCNEEFTNIGGMQRVPLSRQLSIRFSQQRKLTLSRNTTNRWRSATRKVRVCKAILSFALCTVRASTLVLLLFLFTFLSRLLLVACLKHGDVAEFLSLTCFFYCRLLIVIAVGAVFIFNKILLV